MRKFLIAAAVLCSCAYAQLPDFYKTVDRVTWVVKDLKPVVAGWEAADVPVEDYGVDEHVATFRGEQVTVKVRTAAARIGGLIVIWVQPLGGKNAYTEFLARRGDGVFSLVHRVKSLHELDSEVDRMRSAGANVLQRGLIKDPEDGDLSYVYFDTEREGKYALGAYFHAGETDEEELPDTDGPQVTQFAFVAKDTHAASEYWRKAGFPAMSFTHGTLTDPVYRGQPGRFDQELGWQRHGKVVYEWILPLKGPTVYEDAMKVHGEGFHHFGMDVPDMDKAIAAWKALGYPVSQSGGWGEKGKPGSGRFAYIDTDPIGGVTVELLWSYREK